MANILKNSLEEVGMVVTNVRSSPLLSVHLRELLERLHHRFDPVRQQLLERRKQEQQRFDQGEVPGFPEETQAVRLGGWQAAPLPGEMRDRRVEITGPTDRKMMINAMNSGASTFMADLEDSTAPTWENILQGHQNLCDLVRKSISFESEDGRSYSLNERTAVLMVRPRGWHLPEKHFCVSGTPISATLFDTVVFGYHNARELMEDGHLPYLYLPKLEHYLEARLWNEVLLALEQELDLPQGTFKVTVLVETLTASFQLDEIIFELRERIIGLNCGRWDYIFSYIKKLRKHPITTPNRSEITMSSPFMAAYVRRVIRICHQRGILAIGGMAAQIPIRNDQVAHAAALEKVYADKLREVKLGHDGTWVAHPGLVSTAKSVFDQYMPGENQLERIPGGEAVTAAELLEPPKGKCTEEGVRHNINVGLLYLVHWLNGNGAAALYYLMEDAATAEICRAQLWQWYHQKVCLDNGRILDEDYYQELFEKELAKVRHYLAAHKVSEAPLEQAIQLFHRWVLCSEFKEFLTTDAYQYLD